MGIQFSVAVRNARLDAIEATVGLGPRLGILAGDVPVDCAAADPGTLLCEVSLPDDWLTLAANGTKTMNGTWTGTAIAAGTATHFRIVDNGRAVCFLQGTVSTTDGGGDMTLDNLALSNGMVMSILSFTLTDANT